MESTEQATLIFKDQAGEYYVLPQALLERGRIPAEAKAELEAQVPALWEIGTAGDDTQGHAAPVVAGALVVGGAAVFGVSYLISSALWPESDYLYFAIQDVVDQFEGRR
jgi:hypothetical protein